MFGNNGYNIIKTPYKKKNGLVRTNSSNINKGLENENKSLRAEIAKKDQMIVDYRRQVEYLQKRLSELTRNSNSGNNNNYRSSDSNNYHYQRSSSQSNPHERQRNNYEGNRGNRMFGNFDEFTEAFFSEPFAFFNDQIFNSGNRNRISNERNRTFNHNYHNYNSVPQHTDIEEDIIDQLCPNPDNMTYEQLLALEEQVGSVSKGLSKSDINVSHTL